MLLVLYQSLPFFDLILTNELQDQSVFGTPRHTTKGNMMNKKLKGVIAGTAIVAAMGVAGLGVVGNAHAQSDRMNFAGASNVAMANGNGSMAGPRDGHGPSKNVAAIASVLKLTEAELKTQLQSGKTLAQIATAQSVSVQSVVNVLVADMQAHIAEEVASGEMTQAQADTKLAGVTTKVTEMVNTGHPARGKGMQGHGPGMKGHGQRGHHNNETTPNA